MNIIAQQGEMVFLVIVGDDMARVLDLNQTKFFPPFNVHSILARGYWEEFKGSQSILPELLEKVEILADDPPAHGGMRILMHDIESGDHLATIESRHNKVITWENPDPSCSPTINEGMSEDFFDHVESWTQLIPNEIVYRGNTYTKTDGDDYIFALLLAQPSNIVHFVPHSIDKNKFEEFKKAVLENIVNVQSRMEGYKNMSNDGYVQLWRINLKSDAKPGIDPRSFCIERNILGVGWQVDCETDSLDWESYLGIATDKNQPVNYLGNTSWQAAINAIKDMKIGDLCWTRDTKGIYYLGKITGEWEHLCSNEYREADIVNIRKCEWIEVGLVDSVPGKVVNSFIPRRTVQRIYDDSALKYSKYLYNERLGEEIYPIKGEQAEKIS